VRERLWPLDGCQPRSCLLLADLELLKHSLGPERRTQNIRFGHDLGGHRLPPVALPSPAQVFSEVGGVEPVTYASRACLVHWSHGSKSALASCSQADAGGGRWLATAVRGHLRDTGTMDVMPTQRPGCAAAASVTRALRVSDAEQAVGADGQGGATADREGDARVGVAEVHVGEYRKARQAVLTGNDLLQQ